MHVCVCDGWRISALSILDDTASTIQQDEKDGKRYNKNEGIRM